MEFQINNVPSDVDASTLKAALAKVLHSPAFLVSDDPGLPLPNFSLRLNESRQPSAKPHDGRGTLGIANDAMARRFFEKYCVPTPQPAPRGTQPLSYGNSRPQQRGRRVGPPATPKKVFEIGRRQLEFIVKGRLDSRIVQQLKLVPYLDPHAEMEEKKLMDSMEPATFSYIQFGRMCRTNTSAFGTTFSAEWELRLDMSRESPQVIFGVKERELELRFNKIRYPDYFLYAVVIPWNRLSSIIWDDQPATDGSTSHPSAVLHLEVPPAFERRPPANQPGRRMRTSFLSFHEDFSHEPLAPYISNTIRVVFPTPRDLKHFKENCRTVALPLKRSWTEIKCSSRSLFSQLEEVELWLTTMDLRVALQCAALYLNGSLSPSELLDLRPKVDALFRRYPNSHDQIGDILNHFSGSLQSSMRASFHVPRKAWGITNTNSAHGTRPTLSALLDHAELVSPTEAFRHPLRNGIMRTYSVIVTPTSLHLEGPYVDQSNRVLRLYPSHQQYFIRAKFTDEDHLRLRKDFEIDAERFVKHRVGGVLKSGLDIAGRHFDFLGYSLSALREHAVWMVTPFDHPEDGRVTAQSIRERLGDFSKDIYCPARYGARLAQAFSATEPSICLTPEEIIRIPDISRFGSLFTDGVGTISPDIAKQVSSSLAGDNAREPLFVDFRASAYQFRMGGFKGVLVENPLLKGSQVCVRPSMDKFDAPDSLELEIAKAFQVPMQFFLNRPLVMILDCLGVPKDVFLDLQQLALEELSRMQTSLNAAVSILEMHKLGEAFHMTYVVKNIRERLGLDINEGTDTTFMEEPFLRHCLNVAKAHVLRELRSRARIPVPQSWTVVGVADEYSILAAREIYACIQLPGGEPFWLDGPTLVTRSPAMGAGDIQRVTAIGKPPDDSPFLASDIPLRNCVVFSCKGRRSVPSMLGGGDLDGDIFNLIQYEPLFPKDQHDPDDYDPALRTELDRPCEIDDLADFVVDYVNNDLVGKLANDHLIMADQEPKGVLFPNCEELAKLYALALDFTKTGTAIDIASIPKVRLSIRPDYMANELQEDTPDTRHYPSQRALGHLYRCPDLKVDPEEIRDYDWITDEKCRSEPDILHERVKELIGRHVDVEPRLNPKETFRQFASELSHICANIGLHPRAPLLQESEALMGVILGKTSQVQVRRDRAARLRLQTTELVNWVRAEIEGSRQDTIGTRLQRAWAVWTLARDKGTEFGAKSFGFIALGSIFDYIKRIEVLQVRAAYHPYEAATDELKPETKAQKESDNTWTTIPTTEGSENGIKVKVQTVESDAKKQPPEKPEDAKKNLYTYEAMVEALNT